MDQATDGGAWVNISTGYFAGAQFTFRVRAINGGGASAYTATVYGAPLTPEFVDAFQETVGAEQGITYQFTHPAQTGAGWITGYQLEARNATQSESWQPLAATGTAAATSLQFLGVALSSGTPSDSDEIELRIRAYKGSEYSPWSSTTSVSWAV